MSSYRAFRLSHLYPGRPHLRRPALLGLTAALGLSAALAAMGPGQYALAADPAADCAVAYPISELSEGDAVNGLTVTRGTTPSAFTGEVIGVLENGIAPGLDMVLMNLESPEIDRVGGIWQGMSGSPVYAADGRLIGAVAYGLAYGSTPVAGITPFEDMDEYLPGARPAGRAELDPAMARKVARNGDVTARQAGEGLRQLPMPLGVAGVGANRVKSTADRPYLDRDAYALGRTTSAAAGPETIVAGGNIGASLSYGDITLAGVGTATSVCGGRVVGFGHPMIFGGETSLGLHPASALVIQEDPLGVPFKVANIGDPAGTITDDRLTGISGVFGPIPSSTTVASTVTKGSKSRTGTTEVNVVDATAEATFYQLLANHDRVIDGQGPGSEVQSTTINGTDEKGAAYSITLANRYTSRTGTVINSSYPVADLVYSLTSLAGVSVDSVTATATATSDASEYRIVQIQQRRAGAWKKLNGRNPGTIKARKKLKLRYVLRSSAGTRTVRDTYRIPKQAAGSRLKVRVNGGNQGDEFFFFEDFGGRTNTVARIKKNTESATRNDEISTTLFTAGQGGGPEGFGFEFFRGGAQKPFEGIDRERTKGPLDRVVGGRLQSRIKVIG